METGGAMIGVAAVPLLTIEEAGAGAGPGHPPLTGDGVDSGAEAGVYPQGGSIHPEDTRRLGDSRVEKTLIIILVNHIGTFKKREKCLCFLL